MCILRVNLNLAKLMWWTTSFSGTAIRGVSINGTEFEKAAMLRAEGTYDPCLKDRGFK